MGFYRIFVVKQRYYSLILKMCSNYTVVQFIGKQLFIIAISFSILSVQCTYIYTHTHMYMLNLLYKHMLLLYLSHHES